MGEKNGRTYELVWGLEEEAGLSVAAIPSLKFSNDQEAALYYKIFNHLTTMVPAFLEKELSHVIFQSDSV